MYNGGQVPSVMNRTLLSTIAMTVVVVLAGCAGAGPGGPSTTASPTDDPTGTSTVNPEDGSWDGPTGTLDFYVSDQPNAIDDFQYLNVTIDQVVLISAEGEEDDHDDDDAETDSPTPTQTEPVNETPTATQIANATSTSTVNSTATVTATATPNGTETSTATEADDTEAASDEDDADDAEGRIIFDVEERSIDLTRLQGANATLLGQFDVPAGTYAKVFLEVSEVNATLTSGDEANVKLPSEKLQLTKPFEVSANNSIDFVFDIGVHKAGQSGKYILRPVISESGTDVPIQRVGGPPDDRGSDDAADDHPGERDRRGNDERDDDDRDDDRETLSVTVIGNVTPGTDATIEVTANDTPVENATVIVNDEVAGTTDVDGTLTFAVSEDADSIEVEVEAGEAEGELGIEFEDETENDRGRENERDDNARGGNDDGRDDNDTGGPPDN